MSKNTKNRDFSWLLSQLEEYGINTKNPGDVTENSILYFMLTPDENHILVRSTLTEYWLMVTSFRLMHSRDLEKLAKILEYTSKLKYVKLYIPPDQNIVEQGHRQVELGFEILLDNYDPELFFQMHDCLCIAVDKLVEYSGDSGVIKVGEDPEIPEKSILLS